MYNENNYKESTAFKRRSIRKYKNMPVEAWKKKALIESVLNSQSARNQMPWEVVIVEDGEMLAKLEQSMPHALALKTASLALIITSNPNYKENMTANLIEQDLAIASHQVCSFAYEIGLGTVWCAGHPYKERVEPIRKLLNIPENVLIFSVIAVGYSDEVKEANNKWDEAKVHYNVW